MRKRKARARPAKLGKVRVIFKTFGVVVRASPLLCCAMFGLTLLAGVVPVGSIVVTSALLDAIVSAAQAGHITAIMQLPQSVLVLLALLGGFILLTRLTVQLRSIVENLYQKRLTNYIALLITAKASSLDFPFFENPDQQNRMSNASTEASFRPMMIVNQLGAALTSLATLVSVMIVLLLWQPWIVPVVVGAGLITFIVSACRRASGRRGCAWRWHAPPRSARGNICAHC
jgi:ABC-type multidrug transport system fused ATPase/permease subunit